MWNAADFTFVCGRDSGRRNRRNGAADCGRHSIPSRSMGGLQPSVDLALGLVLGEAVTLLQSSGQFLALALDHIEVIVGELAPFLLNLALELLPVAFDTIPIHVALLRVSETGNGGETRAAAKGSVRLRSSTRSKIYKGAADLNVDCALDDRPSTGRGKWAADHRDNAAPARWFLRVPKKISTKTISNRPSCRRPSCRRRRPRPIVSSPERSTAAIALLLA